MSISDESDPKSLRALRLVLRRQIAEGTLAPGMPTPSVTLQLRKPGTPGNCAKALRVLEDEGLLVRIPGLGYYVQPPAREHRLASLIFEARFGYCWSARQAAARGPRAALASLYGIEHISSGEVLPVEARPEPRCAGPRGRRLSTAGRLVPDQMVFNLVIPVVVAAAARGGYILDGFPRTVAQAKEAFDVAERTGSRSMPPSTWMCPSQVLLQRLLARARPND